MKADSAMARPNTAAMRLIRRLRHSGAAPPGSGPAAAIARAMLDVLDLKFGADTELRVRGMSLSE